ncbi:YafY family protein [Streptomyces sp. NBRC 109706]|uniref:helix-turn-helix transcriptional regulator n=1 Tax=Streptomyces sp. NBRC 109706 TaxID=1550035 RepID=UPI000785AE3E|nr:YafY family protein [Streptomyces sp. NBRC 109706]
MKFDRLLSTLLLLQQRDLVPASELAQRPEVSVRTVYRDVEALSAAGIPVYAERGRYGGIRLLPGFRTDMTGLTTDEARALFVLVGQSAHSDLGLDRALASALRKMMNALPSAHRPAAELTSRRILIAPDRWLAGPQEETDMESLHTAVLTDRRLQVDYRHSGHTTYTRYTIDPYGLVSKAGTWYLIADQKGKPRLLRADRIRQTTVTAEPVQRRTGVELTQAWEDLRQKVEDRTSGIRIVIRVRHSRLDMVQRITAAHILRRLEDEPPDTKGEIWTRLEMVYPVPPAVRQLLQFGTDVEVVKPPEAVRELKRTAERVAKTYTRKLPEHPPKTQTQQQ